MSRDVLTWADSTAFIVALYAIAGATALLIGVAERRRSHTTDPRFWPPFWFSVAAFLLLLAVGRASNVSDLLTDLGREQARSGGWYDTRRALQAWVVGGVAAVWAVTVMVAVWRVPERRRRYLPPAVAVFTLACFIGIRLISLHQVDSLLHDHDLGGVTDGAVIEIALLLTLMALSVWRFPRSDLESAAPPGDAEIEASAARSIST